MTTNKSWLLTVITVSIIGWLAGRAASSPGLPAVFSEASLRGEPLAGTRYGSIGGVCWSPAVLKSREAAEAAEADYEQLQRIEAKRIERVLNRGARLDGYASSCGRPQCTICGTGRARE